MQATVHMAISKSDVADDPPMSTSLVRSALDAELRTMVKDFEWVCTCRFAAHANMYSMPASETLQSRVSRTWPAVRTVPRGVPAVAVFARL